MIERALVMCVCAKVRETAEEKVCHGSMVFPLDLHFCRNTSSLTHTLSLPLSLSHTHTLSLSLSLSILKISFSYTFTTRIFSNL